MVLALGYGLSLGGLIPRGDGHRFAVFAAGLALAILVGFEVGDTLAARRPGAATLMSACPCQVQVPELKAEMATLRDRLDGYDTLWSTMSPDGGPSGSSDSLVPFRSHKTA